MENRNDTDGEITRPFAVFVEPAQDLDGEWIAHIVGDGLDYVTQGNGPLDALWMAHDCLLAALNLCDRFGDLHNYNIPTDFPALGYDGEPEHRPAWRCSKCDSLCPRKENDDANP